jgi:hypothetical protein
VTGRSPVPHRRPAPRALLVLPAIAAMLVGLDAGLTLLGVWAPVPSGRLGEHHGVLMVLGFVGTLIAVERAVALGRPLGYAVPAAYGAGALLLLPEPTTAVGADLLVLGAAGLCLLYVPLWRRQRDDAVLVSALGAVLALGGALLWRGGAELSAVVPWLVGFVVLTIGGERLELARLAMPAGAAGRLLGIAATLCLGVAAATLWPAVGTPVLAAGLLALVGWLAAHDVARRTVRGAGFPRFVAACMLAGQVWLAVAGVTMLVAGDVAGGPGYDAVVHAVFLGFTMSMIMAHAPTILPAVTRHPLPYHPAMYLPWLLLQASLLLRVAAGDGLGIVAAREIGGVGNAVALLLFFAVVLGSAVGVRRTPRSAREAVAR